MASSGIRSGCGSMSHKESMSSLPAIWASVKRRQWQQALILLAALVQDDKASIAACNAAISGCEKGGQWQQALALLRYIRELRFREDVVSYNCTISACEKGAARWEQALHLVENLLSRGLLSDIVTSSAVISACQKGQHWPEGLVLFSSLEQNLLDPNVVTFTAAVNACDNDSRWPLAIDLLKQLQDLVAACETFLSCLLPMSGPTGCGSLQGVGREHRPYPDTLGGHDRRRTAVWSAFLADTVLHLRLWLRFRR